jgi:spore maturation protein SpmA
LVLNYIWIAFFIIGFIVALVKLIFMGDMTVFPEIMNGTFDNAKLGFELSLGLTGIMTLWLGIMKIGEKGGAINFLSRAISPLFTKLFPEIPKNHPVNGSMVMNIAANMLGLDNAATPLGLKAMNELQELNSQKDRASNPMIMFLVLNTSGLTIIPISIMVYRAQLGAADPSDIFLPILIATFVSTLVGIITVSIFQRINLFCKEVLLYLGGMTLLMSAMIYGFTLLSASELNLVSPLIANIILFTIIITFILLGLRKKINVYDSFIEGAKEGFGVAIKIIPFLIAILVAVGVFRASGAMDYLMDGLKWLFASTGGATEWIDAFPVALMKPLSGSGARGLMVDTMTTIGVDSFAGRLAATFQGATDTTFYIIAVYFGSVGIKNTRYAVTAGLIADFAGVIAAIFVAYLFFG